MIIELVGGPQDGARHRIADDRDVFWITLASAPATLGETEPALITSARSGVGYGRYRRRVGGHYARVLVKIGQPVPFSWDGEEHR